MKVKDIRALYDDGRPAVITPADEREYFRSGEIYYGRLRDAAESILAREVVAISVDDFHAYLVLTVL